MDKTAINLYKKNASLGLFVKFNSIENVKKICNSLGQPLKKGDFTRDRLFSIERLMGYLLMPRTDTSSVSLSNYFYQIGIPDCPTKGAFTQRRKLLPYGMFKEELEQQVRALYTKRSDLRLWHGHLLFSLDGTVLSLPDTQENRKVFLKGRKSGNEAKALARSEVMADCLNDLIWSVRMESYDVDEIAMAVDLLGKIPEEIRAKRPVCLIDRMYCAYPVIFTLIDNEIDFVVRIKKGFNKEVDDFLFGNELERVVTISPKRDSVNRMRKRFGLTGKREIRVRLVRMSDNTVVMTSLTDMSLSDLRITTASASEEDVYKWRWRIEVTIGFMKNSEMAEIFSGIKPDNLRQDYICRAVLYNLLTETITDAAEMRRQKSAYKASESRYRLIVDKNVALGLLCLRLPQLISHKGDFVKEYAIMLKQMGRSMIPVKPGRSYPRLFRTVKKSGKYITLTNYKKAI